MTIRPAAAESLPWSLLLLADPSREHVSTYINDALIFVGEDDGAAVAVAAVERRGFDLELRIIAVAEDRHGRGIGRRMLEHVLLYASDIGVERVTVGTGNSSLRPLAFYQRNGFRITGVIRGFFDPYKPAIIENGIPCRDMIRLAFEIKR
jgi:GNAT superfamily N-acetyltransferase